MRNPFFGKPSPPAGSAGIIAMVIGVVIVKPIIEGWYGDSILSDLLIGATGCVLGLGAAVVVGRIYGPWKSDPPKSRD